MLPSTIPPTKFDEALKSILRNNYRGGPPGGTPPPLQDIQRMLLPAFATWMELDGREVEEQGQAITEEQRWEVEKRDVPGFEAAYDVLIRDTLSSSAGLTFIISSHSERQSW